jgi:hypothetical protein
MKRLNAIQLILTLIAIPASIGCVVLGLERAHGVEGSYYVNFERYAFPIEVDSGLNGAALGLGIISSVCIICIVWIEVSRAKLTK